MNATQIASFYHHHHHLHFVIIIIIRIPFISAGVTDSVNATQMTCDYPTGEDMLGPVNVFIWLAKAEESNSFGIFTCFPFLFDLTQSFA